MNRNAKRLVFGGLVPFLLLTLLSLTLLSRLDCGLVRLVAAERTIAQSKRSSLFGSSFFAGASAISPQRHRRTSRSRVLRQVGDLFKSNCARCHGADGSGDTPLGHLYNAPDFTDPDWWQKHAAITSTRSLASIVSRGKGGMPAFGKKLTRPEINLLVNYVRRFRDQK
jgi:cytochrome c5